MLKLLFKPVVKLFYLFQELGWKMSYVPKFELQKMILGIIDLLDWNPTGIMITRLKLDPLLQSIQRSVWKTWIFRFFTGNFYWKFFTGIFIFLTLGVNFPGNFISRKSSIPSFLSIFRLYTFGIRGSPAGLPAINSPDHEHNLLDYFKVE